MSSVTGLQQKPTLRFRHRQAKLDAVLTINTSSEDGNLLAAIPGEVGTIALRVTLDEAHPAVLEKYSGLSPEPAAVPEPATLGLLGLGVLGLIAAGMRRKHQ